MKQPDKTVGNDNIAAALQIINAMETKNGIRIKKSILRLIVVGCLFGLVLSIVLSILFMATLQDMQKFYNNSTESVIITKDNINLTNSWERLPVQQRKERLREQYYQIIRYYTNNLPPDQKMSDDQILETFNTLWGCNQRIPSINFFLAVAYMKEATNFNPAYNGEFRRGISGFYLKTLEEVCNLPLVREDIVFKTFYRGVQTANNPSESIKLLIARIDDLMHYFNNREDWVLLALFTNEYSLTRDSWNNGEGTIPDKLYQEGKLANALMYYHAFKNWQIPSISLE